MAKAKPTSPFTGSWRIVSMSAWEDDYLDEEGEAFIDFNEEGCGSFQFGYVRGFMDHYRTKKRDGKHSIQFSWDGGDGADGTPLQGIGCGHRLVAPPGDRLRWHGDSTGPREAPGSSTLAGLALPGIAGAVSSGRAGRGRLSAQEALASGPAGQADETEVSR